MRWVHLLGLGFVIGFTALGFAVSVALLRWNEIVYPPQSAAAGVQGAPQAQGASIPPDAAAGQTIFQQKCSSCHKIGGGRLVGPDLKGVTQQESRDFLVQMITAPEQALQTDRGKRLLAEYGAPMPNVGVNQQQAGQILAYIDFQSGGAAPAQAGGQPTGGPAPTAAPGTKAPTGAAAPGGAQAAGDPNKGKASFDQKCSSCHNIGGGRKVGPDLKGVTSQQSHDWLVSMITGPDKWTQSDPTAQQLLKEYGVQMPNLGISQGEANDIIAYIQQQSGGAMAPPPAPAAPIASHSATWGQQPLKPLMATASAVAVFDHLAGLLGPLFQQPAGNPDQGKNVFQQKCAGCHSIGGGRMAGPDLKGATSQRPHDFLIGMITQPDKLLASDPTAQQLQKEYGLAMPNLGVSQQQAEDIVAYIQQQSGGQGAPPGGGQQAPQIQPGNAQNGQALFTGEKRLSGGGPACIACHNVSGVGAFGGGSVGLDLTKEQSKLGTNGIVNTLKAPAFPGMKEAYTGHQITDPEAADLAGFFIEADKREPGNLGGMVFPFVGLLAFLVMMGIAAIPWLGRTRSVRKSLVGGAGR